MGDVRKLQRDFPELDLNYDRIVDLSDLAKAVDRTYWAATSHIISLQELTGTYLRRHLSKSARGATNWERLDLSTEALQCALFCVFGW